MSFRFRLIPQAGEALVLAMVVAIGVSGVFVARGLYADGALFLLNILEGRGYWDYDPARTFAQLVMQSPVVLALRLGVRDMGLLVPAHSFGLIALPLLVWLCTFLLAARTQLFWPMTLAFSVSYLTTGFFAIGEFNLVYASSALCCVLLLRAEFGIGAAVALVLCAFTLTRSYEAMVFLGPLLFVLSIRRLLDDETRKRPWRAVAIAAASFLFSAASALAAWSILNPRDPGNLAGATNFVRVIRSPHFAFVVLMLCAYGVLHLVRRPMHRAFPVLLAVVAAIVYLVNVRLWNTPQMHYAFRSVSGLLLFAVLSMAIVPFFRVGRPKPASSVPFSCAVVALALFVGLSIPVLVNSIRFSAWMHDFESAAVGVEHWIPIDETPAYHGGGLYDGFSWPWANPALSLIVRGNNDAGVLNHSGYRGWQPFEPERMSDNPLENYRKGSGQR